MKDLISKARNGSQEAVKSLYDANKKTVFGLCRYLLADEQQASKATSHVFKKLFEELMAGRITTQKEFELLAIRKSVQHCKALSLQKSSRAFRTPANSNFAAVSYDPERIEPDAELQQLVLKNLPIFHRYIYVLSGVCAYSAQQLSTIFGVPVRAIENALNAEAVNVDKLLSAAGKKLPQLPPYSVQQLHTDWVEALEEASVPDPVDASVAACISTLCEPIEKQRRRKGSLLLGIIGVVAVLVVVVLLLMLGGGDTADADLDNLNSDTTAAEMTEQQETTADEIVASYYADIAIEDYGTITVALNAEAAPETVANFVSLAESGFYDGLTFHRIIDTFMMQGGDPDADGNGGNTDADGNKLTITGEFSANGFDNPLSHTAGAISMARSSDYNSASSQFFIVHTSDYTSSLDGNYACFGYVTEGMDIVDAICSAADPDADNGMLEPEDQPVITSITIRLPETADAAA